MKDMIKTERVEKGDGVWTKDKWTAKYKTCSGTASTEKGAVSALNEAVREARAFGEI